MVLDSQVHFYSTFITETKELTMNDMVLGKIAVEKTYIYCEKVFVLLQIDLFLHF